MTGVLALTVILLVVVAYLVTQRALTRELDQALAREASAYSAAMRSAPDGQGLADATREYLGARTAGGTGTDAVLLVVLEGGTGGRRILSNSVKRFESAPGNTSLRSVPADPTYSDFEFLGEEYRALSVPVSANGQAAGAFQAVLAKRSVAATARGVALTLAAAGLIVLALGVPLSYLASRRALTPLRSMALDAESISHPLPGQRIEYQGPPDELGTLADALNRMLARIEHSYEEQRQFVADASHELRTPVAVVRGNVELLRSGQAQGADAEESLEMIESESIRMGKLLDELLSLARLESSPPPAFQPLEVRTLLDEVAGRTRSLAPDRDVRVAGACDLWVLGEPDLLDQALANLARNAIAHTGGGGVLRFACSATEQQVLLSLTDDGPGIAEADVPRLFDRFFRGAPDRGNETAEGAGLGLAIAQRIVQLHGGRIMAENVEPHGARFTIALPRIDVPS